MSRYIKSIVALLGGISSWGITAAADDAITQVEIYGLLGVLATVLGVYAFPNTPPAGEPADPAMSEQGAANWLMVTAVASVIMCVILVLWAFDTGPLR